MLPVKKHDTERDDSNPSAADGFSKVLGSIQGLQQRLGDFSYGEVSIAEAKVKMLVKQLALLRDNLNNVVQLKLSLREINRRASEIPVVSYDQVSVDSLEKHPQLHAILQASKLARFQRLINGDLDGAEVESLATALSADLPDPASGEKGAGPKTVVDRPRPLENKQPSEAFGSTRGATGDAWVGARSTAIKHRIAPKSHELLATAEEPPSFTIPNETIATSQDDQVRDQSKDWSFDPHETVLTSSESFTAPINFEFPAETVDDQEPISKNVSKTKVSRTAPPPTATVSQTPIIKPNAMVAKTVVAARAIAAKPAPKRSEAIHDDSKALVPANHNFDQRLLEDVIKNYGDFAVTPNLPATLDTSTKIIAVTDKPAKSATEEFAEPTAAARKILNVQKSGDLDRQLKKIIKDYGEYDIYQRKSAISVKTGGVIAFAVLGLVLVVLYLFKAPRAASTRQTGLVTQPQVAAERNPPEAVKSPITEEQSIGPDAANASTGSLTDGKQKP